MLFYVNSFYINTAAFWKHNLLGYPQSSLLAYDRIKQNLVGNLNLLLFIAYDAQCDRKLDILYVLYMEAICFSVSDLIHKTGESKAEKPRKMGR